MALQDFTTSQPLTLGVELELQLVSTHDYDLAPQAEDLLRKLELDRARVAVEHNRRVVPRAEHAGLLLNHGDQLEIVTFVGGG